MRDAASRVTAAVQSLALRLAHAVVTIIAALVVAWTAWRAAAAPAAARWAARAPGGTRLARLLLHAPRAAPAGSPPAEPTVLGVVVAEDLEATAAAAGRGREETEARQLGAVCLLLRWAARRGVRHVLLYDPGGALRRRAPALHGRLNAECDARVRLREGWRRGGDDGDDSVGGGDENSATPPPVVEVLLLSAADAEWPLRAAAAAAPAAPAAPPPPPAAPLEAAAAAPARLRARLAAAAGPAAALEPDLVLIAGRAPTLAGFPPWAVRASELAHVGPLAALTAAALDAAAERYARTRQRHGR